MKGTRPLDNPESRLVSVGFDGTFEARNRSLFMLGVSTGGRISELLSLWQTGARPALRQIDPDEKATSASEVVKIQ